MAKNYKTFSYFESRPDIVKIFEDLEAYHDFCRFELIKFDPSELYRRDSPNYIAFFYNKKPRKPFNNNKNWNGKPKHHKKP